MYVTNFTDEYDNLTSSNYTDMTLSNCTNDKNNIEIKKPLFTIIPCGIPFICLISLMVYTLIKPLLLKK